MAGTVGILGAPSFTDGQGGIAGPGTGNPPVPPDGTFSNTTGTFMPANAPVLLNSAFGGAPDGVVFPGVFITSQSSPASTGYGWTKVDSLGNLLGFYLYVSGIGWQLIASQGPQGIMGSAGAGSACLLNSDFTAGALLATGLYANPATPSAFPVGQNALVSDSTAAQAYYLVTAMCAVQQAAPASGPTLGAVTAAGTLGAGVWKVATAYRNSVGVTTISSIISVTLTAGQVISVGSITPPAGYQVDYYVSIAAGSSTLQFYQTTAGTAFNITAPGSGATVPSINTTQGVLMTRQSIGSVAGSYVFSVANTATMEITGPQGPAGGTSGAARSTTLNGSFIAGNFGTSYTINVAAGTGTQYNNGDEFKIADGTATAYYNLTAVAANSVTGTRQDVSSDPAQAGTGYTFASGTDAFWTGPIGATGSVGAAGAINSLLTADFTAGAENATGLTFTVASAAPFSIGTVGQMTDSLVISGWYQVTDITGLTIEVTRLPVEPPGVAVAGSGYDFEVANNAVFSVSGPTGGTGATGGTVLVQLDQPLTGTVDGANATFILPIMPVNSFAVYRDGVRCKQGLAGTLGFSYTALTRTVVFDEAPNQFCSADIA